MPELPEVETIARTLRRKIVGKSIADVALSGLALRRPVEESFAGCLSGRTIRRIHRRGKYLVLEMQPRAYCLVHLGMSGRLFFRAGPEQALRHTHAIIRFSDGSELHFVDHRRFGLLSAYELPRLGLLPELRHLGPDPSGRGFHQEELQKALSASKQQLKSFLLDQHRIAGLGNIYACETLFQARLHPERRCFTLTERETGALTSAIRRVVRAAIRHRGTSFSDFIDSDGMPGDNQHFLRVFQREGKKCRRCGEKIRRLRQGNRSTFFCPGCQI